MCEENEKGKTAIGSECNCVVVIVCEENEKGKTAIGSECKCVVLYCKGASLFSCATFVIGRILNLNTSSVLNKLALICSRTS